jgi:N-acetylmuramoyl-L-alanine amidase
MLVFKLSRRGLYFCLLPVFLLLGVLGSYVIVTANPLAGKIIVVDAGHGGIDPGANRPGILEKDLNLAVALQLKEVLNGYGAKVVLSRDIDTDLSELCDNEKVKGRYRRDLAARIEMIEESDADLFISIHANSNPNTKRRGAETFYYHKSEQGKALATAIQTELQKVTPSASKAAPGDYFLLKRNKIPAALIEMGYITHPEELQRLQLHEHQRKLAEAVAKGIYTYFQNPLHNSH